MLRIGYVIPLFARKRVIALKPRKHSFRLDAQYTDRVLNFKLVSMYFGARVALKEQLYVKDLLWVLPPLTASTELYSCPVYIFFLFFLSSHSLCTSSTTASMLCHLKFGSVVMMDAAQFC